ncbi:pro-interleukin-16-like isoform X2 [Corticium candelabrum]|uniref:pro-interleukin-16-like isoform X2 n=1 Tax=Corticium candelabrum TaxID=121492 RepID=UPI002E25A602|nr:pro-interleukin-16-like isoform X2 [Corticium candelabrum]
MFLMARFFRSKREKQETGTKETIELSTTEKGFGFNIIGGKSASGMNFGIFVSKITENSAAAKDGRLKCGDQLLKANKQTLYDVTRQQAIDIVKGCARQKVVSLVVLRDQQAQDDYRKLTAALESSTRVRLPDRIPTEIPSGPLGEYKGKPESLNVDDIHVRDGRYVQTWSVPQTSKRTIGAAEFAERSLVAHSSGIETPTGIPTSMLDYRLSDTQTDVTSLERYTEDPVSLNSQPVSHTLWEPVDTSAVDVQNSTSDYVPPEVVPRYVLMSSSSASSSSTKQSSDLRDTYLERHTHTWQGNQSDKKKSMSDYVPPEVVPQYVPMSPSSESSSSTKQSSDLRDANLQSHTHTWQGNQSDKKKSMSDYVPPEVVPQYVPMSPSSESSSSTKQSSDLRDANLQSHTHTWQGNQSDKKKFVARTASKESTVGHVVDVGDVHVQEHRQSLGTPTNSYVDMEAQRQDGLAPYSNLGNYYVPMESADLQQDCQTSREYVTMLPVTQRVLQPRSTENEYVPMSPAIQDGLVIDIDNQQ